MRFKLFGIALLLITFSVLLVACDPSIKEESADDEEVWLPLDVCGSFSKSIQVEYGTNTGKYEYKIRNCHKSN